MVSQKKKEGHARLKMGVVFCHNLLMRSFFLHGSTILLYQHCSSLSHAHSVGVGGEDSVTAASFCMASAGAVHSRITTSYNLKANGQWRLSGQCSLEILAGNQQINRADGSMVHT